jgi:hypothetical protein
MADLPYGLLAEFRTEDEIIHAAREARRAGYRDIDAFTPFPVERLAEIMHLRDSRPGWLGLAGGIFGFLAAYGMQAFVSYDYPLNVGGRPVYPFSAYAVVIFELTILFSVLFLFIGLLALNRLPRLNYPVFNASRFRLASKDRFFLCIKSEDEKFDREATASFLKDAGAVTVELVPP